MMEEGSWTLGTKGGGYIIETIGSGLLSTLVKNIAQKDSLFKLLLLWKGPAIGILVTVASTAVAVSCCYRVHTRYTYRPPSRHQQEQSTPFCLRQEVDTLRIENAQLKTRTRTLTKETRDMRRSSTCFAEENKEMMERIRNLECRTLSLIESLTEKEGSIQLHLIKQIYREQIVALRNENEVLSKKNEDLSDTLNCSICFSQEANCLIRPCGHTLCSDCYKEIEKQWSQSSKYLQNIGPSCPFCRNEVQEVLPKL